MDYTVFTNFSEISKERRKATVVRCEDEQGVTIDYIKNGQLYGIDSYFCISDMNDRILNFKYTEKVYVQKNAKSMFNFLCKYAQKYRDCDCNLEKFMKLLEQEEEEQRRQLRLNVQDEGTCIIKYD